MIVKVVVNNIKIKAAIRTKPHQAILDFTDHLSRRYPLNVPISIELIRTDFLPYFGIRCISGQMSSHFFTFNPDRIFYTLKVCLGKRDDPRPLDEVLHTLGHEYKHAIQRVEKVPSDCKEADRFAADEQALFFPMAEAA